MRGSRSRLSASSIGPGPQPSDDEDGGIGIGTQLLFGVFVSVVLAAVAALLAYLYAPPIDLSAIPALEWAEAYGEFAIVVGAAWVGFVVGFFFTVLSLIARIWNSMGTI